MPYIEAQRVHLSPLRMVDVTTTYNGETGCACGCGGDYADAGTPAATRRMNVINKAIEEGRLSLVQISGGQIIYEVETGEERVTRVYTEWT